MPISDERIEELRRVYKQAYGEDITMEEAREMGQRLVELYTILLKPLPGSDEHASSAGAREAPAQTA